VEYFVPNSQQHFLCDILHSSNAYARSVVIEYLLKDTETEVPVRSFMVLVESVKDLSLLETLKQPKLAQQGIVLCKWFIGVHSMAGPMVIAEAGSLC
jgi:hypothetical protein